MIALITGVGILIVLLVIVFILHLSEKKNKREQLKIMARCLSMSDPKGTNLSNAKNLFD